MNSVTPASRPPAPTLLFAPKEYSWMGRMAVGLGGLAVLFAAWQYFGRASLPLWPVILAGCGLVFLVLGFLLLKGKHSPDGLVNFALAALASFVVILGYAFRETADKVGYGAVLAVNLAAFIAFLILRRRTKL